MDALSTGRDGQAIWSKAANMKPKTKGGRSRLLLENCWD
jgi:hypothetical protein